MRSRFVTRFQDIEESRQNWSWFLALGILLIVLGCAIIGTSFYKTLLSIVLLGCFLIAGGVIQIIQAVLARRWSGLFLSLALGLIYIIAGFLCVLQPYTTAITLTFWIAVFCFVVGLYKMAASAIIRFENWIWFFVGGLIIFLLGFIIYNNWPLSGLWVIGLFIGIDMILSGLIWVGLALEARPKKGDG
jgi:uncharacterized membrane protein HdeD (DUF308 family)